MTIPYDLGPYVVRIMKEGATPDGDDLFTWVPGHTGRILGGWGCLESNPTSTGTAAVTAEIGTTSAITWSFTSAHTDYKFVAGTLSTTDTDLHFDTDDVLTLNATSADESEATLSVWLLVQGR